MDGGVVDEAIESAVVRLDNFDQSGPCSGITDVGDDVDLPAEIGGYDVPPARAEHRGFRSALSPPRTRDHGDRTHASCERPPHRISSSICRNRRILTGC